MYEPNFSPDEIKLVLQLQERQIANPTSNMLASQAMYVRDELAKINVSTAHRYWMAVCMGANMGDNAITENEAKMRNIDRKKPTIDTWGT